MPKKKKEIKVELIKVLKHINPDTKRRCLNCECPEYEHEQYWNCPHLQGDICDVCCWYDSMDPNWNWKECDTCEHDKERDKNSLEEEDNNVEEF